MGEIPLFFLRALLATVGLLITGRMLTSARAYMPWRAYVFLTIAVIAYILMGGYRFNLLLNRGVPNDPALFILEMTFMAGLVAALWERGQADYRRHADSQKLMEQWRQASNLAQKRARELETLSEINRELTSSLELRVVLQTVADRALGLGEADAVNVFGRNQENGELGYHVSATRNERLRDLPPPRQNGLTMTVAKSGEAAFISDTRSHSLYADGAYPDMLAVASLPLRFEDNVIGVMNVGYTHKHTFEEDEMRMLNLLADAASLAVHNASLHEQIAKLAVTDELTGLANRRRFLQVVRAEVQRARRYERALSLVMLDLDRLKQINDHDGHAAGDAMLRGIAQCMRASVRDTDLCARLSGDEFAVVLPETAPEGAAVIAERIRKAVENFSVVVNGATIASTVSVGLVCCQPGELPDLPTFIRMADEALYHSKKGGRNAVTTTIAAPISAPVPAEH